MNNNKNKKNERWKKPGLILPDDIEKVTLVAQEILSLLDNPKLEKGAILGDFTKKQKCLCIY
jgi:hypothetical protein